MLEPGREVDRYQVQELLGEGGMAEVYLVRHRTLGSLHALKVLKFEMPGLTARLVQEGKVQASLRHPNVVAVTDVIEVSGKPGLVMEYVSGPTLAQWLASTQPTLEEAEGIFLGILAGVAKAHRIGLVHRDLKPGNVLLEVTDEGLVPKVADFGLVKLLDEQGGRTRTRSGLPMGTPAYMAPEQVRDAASVDQRADVFALGCILYELVVGLPPYDAADALTIFAKLAKGEYSAAESLVPTLPERFRRAIRGALAHDRDDRIADCATLRALFKGGAEASESSAHVVPIRDPVARPTIAHTLNPAGHGRLSGSDTFAADGVAGGAEASTIAPRDQAPQKRHVTALIAGGIGVAGIALLGLMLVGGAAWWWSPKPASTPIEVRMPEPIKVVTPAIVIPEVPAPVLPPVAAAKPRPAPPVIEAHSPPPAADPAPPVPTPMLTGTVQITGDADEVWLERAGARVSPLQPPPGDYDIRARFGGETLAAGTVRIRAGETATIACSAAFKLCRAK